MADELNDTSENRNKEEEEDDDDDNDDTKQDHEQQTETDLHKTNREKDMNLGGNGSKIQQVWQVFWQKFGKVLRNIHQKGVQQSINTKLVLITPQEIPMHWI